MSCIPKLLEKKGSEEYLTLSEGVALESGGSYKGYDYCITVNSHGNRCAYVAMPASHPLADEDKVSDLSVHGGVTFFGPPADLVDRKVLGRASCGDVWAGFDAAHAYDMPDLELAKRISGEVCPSLNVIYNMKLSWGDAVHRTKDYMEEECKSLIDQIVEFDKNNNLTTGEH